MKKIAISINTSWNIYNFRLGLIKALQKEGFEVYAIAPKDDYSNQLDELGVKHIDIFISNKGTNPIEDIKTIWQYYKIYKKLKPDIALHYTIKPNIYGTIGARLAGVKVINNISGLGTVFLNDSISSKIARNLYKIALIFSKKVFFQNPHDRELFIKNKLVKKSKTDLVPGSGIDTRKFKPLEKENKGGKFKFLFIARLVKDKGIIEYVEAARIIKNLKFKIENYIDIEFQILGAFYPGNPTAITKEQMGKWIEKGVINYLGVSDSVQDFIKKSDCVVLPSYREGLSRVLLEAASMAKPIITTDTPGCKDVVDDGINGFLCKVKDSKDLAKKMKKMLNLSKYERINMGKVGREKIINEFDEKIVIKKYLETIKLIDSRELKMQN